MMNDEEKALDVVGLENFAPYLMNRVLGRYKATLRATMQSEWQSTPKIRALALLHVYPGLQMMELAEKAATEPSTLSRALVSLEEEGLIRRKRSMRDKRAFELFLTDAGARIFARLWPQMEQSGAKLFDGIRPEQRQEFVRTLQQMLDNIRLNTG